MTRLKEVYKCEICGNVTEVLHEGIGQLVCCGKLMKLMEEKIKDEGKEKHVPIIEKNKEGVIIKVGSTQHPMEEKHFIEWIEVITEKDCSRKHLTPGEKPEKSFPIKDIKKISKVRIYCNIHGLWKNK